MRRLLFVSMIFIWVLWAVQCVAAGSSIAYTKSVVAGVPINVVTINLNDPDVMITPAITRCGIGSCETFKSLVSRTRPSAAVTGTYFCTRTYRPTGDIVIDGNLLWRAPYGTAMAITPDGSVRFVQTGAAGCYKWYDYENVIITGPTLIFRGKTVLCPRAEGFRSSVHYRPNIRAAIGLTYHNKLLMVTTRKPVYLGKLAAALKRLKCVDAVTLDGGSSAALYCGGRYITRPGRSMTNCILAYSSRAGYQANRGKLFPGSQFAYLSE